ncbi:hypothetical protein CHUAL_001124 [Chamberlinius hualienensis]
MSSEQDDVNSTENGQVQLQQKRKIDLTEQQQQCLINIKEWLETGATFVGRTDDDFVTMFLFACEFDEDFTKKTIAKYYECRRRIPRWWANRDPTDTKIQSVYQQKLSLIVTDKLQDKPTLFLTILSRVGPNEGNFDEYIKASTMIFDIGVRRTNAVANGIKWIIDCSNYKLWFALRLLSPINADHFVFSFLLAAPTRIRHIVVLNAPTIIYAFYKLMQPFLSQELKEKIIFLGSDLSEIFDYVPRELVPNEYGGYAGPLEKFDGK